MKDLVGNIEIEGIRDPNADTRPLSPFDVKVKLDGMEIPMLQHVSVDIRVDGTPTVTMTILPRELGIKLKGVTYKVYETLLQEEEMH